MTSPLKSDSFIDKPLTLSVKDYLIRRMAVKMMTSESVLETVVNHQFQSAQRAMVNNKSVEISGFGKFLFNEKKAIKKEEKFHSQKALFEKMLKDETLTEAKRRNLSMKLQSALDNIRDIKPRMNGSATISDLRGMEEQPDSAQGIGEDNTGD